LRFLEFGEEWKRNRLSESCDIYDGTHQTPQYTKDGVPFVSVEDVTALREIEKKYISEKAFKRDFKIAPKQGDILMTRIGDIGTSMIVRDDDPLAYYVSLALIHPKTINSKYLDSYIASPYFKKELYRRTIHVAFPKKINKEDIGECFISCPNIIEQEKIGVFLELIDERIAIQSKVIEDLRSLYDVICQKLYSSNEKKEWHEFKYADLLTISNERNSRLQYTNVLSASQEYGMVERGELNIDIKYDATSIKNYKIVHPNEYVIHLRSFQGGFAYSDKTGICSPAYTILVPNGKLIPAFLKYYFTSTQFINSLRIVTYGIRDGRSISVEEFLQLKISIPTISEQHYILSVMQLWEEKIRIEECHLSNLQKQKQYLLRQMFI